MKKHLTRLTVLISTLIMCFIISEVIIRGFYCHFSNYNMEMWRYASEIKRPISNNKLPFHHFPNREGIYYGVNIATNSIGFRDNEYSIEKYPGKKRILFLGDSFTFGWGVPLDSLYSKLLEQMLNEDGREIEVINAGIGNYNSRMEVELFKLKGMDLNPDLVILMYFINDVEPTPKRISSFSYFIRSKSYLYGVLFDRYLKLKTLIFDNFSWRKYYTKLYSIDSEALLDNYESLKELSNICKQNKIKLLIVNIPELRELKNYPFPFATEYIRKFANDNDVYFFDLLPHFRDYDPSSLWVSNEDPHANSKTNMIIAKVIYEMISERGPNWF